jgi:hypothetical protein
MGAADADPDRQWAEEATQRSVLQRRVSEATRPAGGAHRRRGRRGRAVSIEVTSLAAEAGRHRRAAAEHEHVAVEGQGRRNDLLVKADRWRAFIEAEEAASVAHVREARDLEALASAAVESPEDDDLDLGFLEDDEE